MVKALDRFFDNIQYLQLLIAILIAWTLIYLWGRVIYNFTYSTLKLDPNSTYIATIIAVLGTVLFLVYIFTFDGIFGDYTDGVLGKFLLNFSTPLLRSENDIRT